MARYYAEISLRHDTIDNHGDINSCAWVHWPGTAQVQTSLIHAINMTWLANLNQDCSHFPYNF